MFQTNGFTLLELLLVVGIMLTVLGGVIPVYGNLQVATQLNESTHEMVQILRIAREKATARLNNAPHGVFLAIDPNGPDRVILYQGNAYATRNPDYDRIFELPGGLILTSDLIGNEINFSRDLGFPSTVGIITLTHTATGSRGIEINSFGKIENL